MGLNLERELAQMQTMTPKQLRDKYAAVCGEPTRSGNRRFLVKRIAWRLQANEEGALPDRVRKQALVLANDADLRTTAPRARAIAEAVGRTVVRTARFSHPNLPMPGTVLTRVYRGQTVIVNVLEDGFEYQGTKYKSLSAAARAVTGTHLSGNAFFGLPGLPRQPRNRSNGRSNAVEGGRTDD